MKTLGSRNARQHHLEADRADLETPFPFTMAFQPIVSTSGVFAYEALVRGPGGESASSILDQIHESDLYGFDQACRVRALELASRLLAGSAMQPLAINFFPGAVYDPEACIHKTLETADNVGMPLSHLIFEVTESERVRDRGHLINVFREYRKHGLQIAIDDFGAGYAGLDLLAEFQPDLVKLDMAIVRDLDKRVVSHAIVRAVASLCQEIGVRIIAEGVESRDELLALQDIGIELFQGYLFGRPALEALPEPAVPADLLHPRSLPSPRSLYLGS